MGAELHELHEAVPVREHLPLGNIIAASLEHYAIRRRGGLTLDDFVHFQAEGLHALEGLGVLGLPEQLVAAVAQAAAQEEARTPQPADGA